MLTPDRCPSCHAPLQPGAPFCGQCGFDIPAEEPGAKPRPEKCPFCSAPVEGEELACRQCGFDFDREWQPEPSEDAGPFHAHSRTCKACGYTYPVADSGEAVPADRLRHEGGGPDICPNCREPAWAHPQSTPNGGPPDSTLRQDDQEEAEKPPPPMIVRVGKNIAGWLLMGGGAILLIGSIRNLHSASLGDVLEDLLVPALLMGLGYYLAFILWRRRDGRDRPFRRSDE